VVTVLDRTHELALHTTNGIREKGKA
jgi:hypothetical protein